MWQSNNMYGGTSLFYVYALQQLSYFLHQTPAWTQTYETANKTKQEHSIWNIKDI